METSFLSVMAWIAFPIAVQLLIPWSPKEMRSRSSLVASSYEVGIGCLAALGLDASFLGGGRAGFRAAAGMDEDWRVFRFLFPLEMGGHGGVIVSDDSGVIGVIGDWVNR